jgi:hypothetical protein
LLTNEALVNPSFGRRELILRDMILTCGPSTKNLKESAEVQEILQLYGSISCFYVDNIGDSPPEPLEFSYKDIIRKSLPSLSGEDLEIL